MLGEYATWRRTAGLGKPVPKDMDMHNKSVDYWASYVTKQAKVAWSCAILVGDRFYVRQS